MRTYPDVNCKKYCMMHHVTYLPTLQIVKNIHCISGDLQGVVPVLLVKVHHPRRQLGAGLLVQGTVRVIQIHLVKFFTYHLVFFFCSIVGAAENIRRVLQLR